MGCIPLAKNRAQLAVSHEYDNGRLDYIKCRIWSINKRVSQITNVIQASDDFKSRGMSGEIFGNWTYTSQKENFFRVLAELTRFP